MKDNSNPFNQNMDETILYHSKPIRKWYTVAWRIGLGILEVIIFILFSFTTFTILAKLLLDTFLPVEAADVLSRVLFQGIAPLLLIAWFVEDTARFFTCELILTDQRIWTKGIPYAWTPGREIPLSDILSIIPRRDALFVRRKSTRKTQVFMIPDGKLIAEIHQKHMDQDTSS